MKTEKWLKELAARLEQEETKHLDIQKARINIQFKNATTGEIELHEWEYVAKGAVNVEIKEGKR